MHRVGVLPFDIRSGDMALLFVTSQTRGRWILPKGWKKKNETNEDACAREAFEEAGVHGTVLSDFAITTVISRQTDQGLEDIVVTYYPFLVHEQVSKWPERKKRERHWTLFEDAKKIVYREDFFNLLQRFEKLQPWIIEAAEDYKLQQKEALKLVR
ncbi:MAG: NUDIX domain-containing protein [Hyphomicrobiales bacterium]